MRSLCDTHLRQFGQQHLPLVDAFRLVLLEHEEQDRFIGRNVFHDSRELSSSQPPVSIERPPRSINGSENSRALARMNPLGDKETALRRLTTHSFSSFKAMRFYSQTSIATVLAKTIYVEHRPS